MKRNVPLKVAASSSAMKIIRVSALDAERSEKLQMKTAADMGAQGSVVRPFY